MSVKMLSTVCFNIIRFRLLKVIHRSNVDIALIQRIKSNVGITVQRGGTISIKKNIEVERTGDIFVGKEGVLKIGEKVYINKNCLISCQHEVSIGDNSLFGPNVMILDNDHKFVKDKGVSPSEMTKGSIVIGDNCWIGANAVILRNTIIGDNTIIGAGCIVKGNIPSNSIVKSDRTLTIKEIV